MTKEYKTNYSKKYTKYDAFHDSISLDEQLEKLKIKLEETKNLKESKELLKIISKYDNISNKYENY